jgi:hypothetical protein
MITKKNIKPCPFCGQQPSFLNRGTGWAMLACENQDCYVKPSLGVNDGLPDIENRAITIWNKRRT